MGDHDKPGNKQMSASSWAKDTARNPDDFEEQDEPMTRTAAERRIDELQWKTGKKPQDDGSAVRHIVCAELRKLNHTSPNTSVPRQYSGCRQADFRR